MAVENITKKKASNQRVHSKKVTGEDKTLGRVMIVIFACLVVLMITQIPNALDQQYEEQYEKVDKHS